MERNKDKKNVVIVVLSVLVVVLIIVILILTSSNNQKTNDEDISDSKDSETIVVETDESSTEETTPHLEKYEAKSIATSKFNSSTDELQSKSGASRIERISVESVELTKTESDYYSDRYTFTFKGNFWGFDEYGNVKAKYKFQMDIVVDNYGNSYTGYCYVGKAY